MSERQTDAAAFAERVKALRAAKGWTQRELAERSGIGKRSIEEYERGRIPRKTVPQLADALDVTAHFLLHGEETIETRIERLIDVVNGLTLRIEQAEALSLRESAATRRTYAMVDAVLRHIAVRVLSDEALAAMPPSPALAEHDGDGHAPAETEQPASRS